MPLSKKLGKKEAIENESLWCGHRSEMTAFPFLKKFIGIKLVCYVVLVSGVQQSGSVTHIHIYIPFQILFSCSYHKILSRVPCAVQ